MSKLLLLDISGIIHRVFHSIDVNKFRRSSDNLPTNAIYGCLRILINLNKKFKDYTFIACLDNKRDTLWRKKLSPSYKQNRSNINNELAIQFQHIEHMLKCLNISTYKIESYEADDVMASICYQHQDKEIIVASSDKDMIQLLSFK